MKITKNNFQKLAEIQGYKIIPEYKFCPKRKFRADWYIEKNKKQILIEYEGIMSNKARHTGRIGYSTDCEKYNLAQSLGFIVLRYTILNFNNVFNDLEKVFNEENNKQFKKQSNNKISKLLNLLIDDNLL